MRAPLAALLILASLAACGGDDPAGPQTDPDNLAPVAALTLPEQGEAGRPTLLDGAASSDEDGRVELWLFDPGDGSPLLESASPQLFHTYAAAGTYTVSLTVIDDNGTKDTERAELVIVE